MVGDEQGVSLAARGGETPAHIGRRFVLLLHQAVAGIRQTNKTNPFPLDKILTFRYPIAQRAAKTASLRWNSTKALMKHHNHWWTYSRSPIPPQVTTELIYPPSSSKRGRLTPATICGYTRPDQHHGL